MSTTKLADLELDLDVFLGPFDLLLSLILRDELDLLEIELADVVLAYLDHLEAKGELDLEATTEFLVLIAILLELKSRLLLPGEEIEDIDELLPEEAAHELLDRMLNYARFRSAGRWVKQQFEVGLPLLYRSAAIPSHLRAKVELTATLNPDRLGRSLGALLKLPPEVNVTHLAKPRVSVAERLNRLRQLLRAGTGSFDFDQALETEDRMTVAVTVYALLELYKHGEANWKQMAPFAPIRVERLAADA